MMRFWLPASIVKADSYLGKGVILGEWCPVNRKINGHSNRNKQQKKYLTRLQLFKNGLSNIFQHLPTISEFSPLWKNFSH